MSQTVIRHYISHDKCEQSKLEGTQFLMFSKFGFEGYPLIIDLLSKVIASY